MVVGRSVAGYVLAAGQVIAGETSMVTRKSTGEKFGKLRFGQRLEDHHGTKNLTQPIKTVEHISLKPNTSIEFIDCLTQKPPPFVRA